MPTTPIADERAGVDMLYSSGTTGRPKGVEITHANLLAHIRYSHEGWEFDDGDKCMVSMPLFHVGGLCIQTLPALAVGAKVSLLPRFEPGTWFDTVEQWKPTTTLLVPAVMKALVASDREAFYASEIEARERALYPPFGRLASLIISAGDRPTAESFARKLVAAAPLDERVQVLGPAEAPLAVIKGRYRFRILVKSVRGIDLSAYMRDWLVAGPKTKGNLKLEVDIDPQSFL